MALGMAGVGAVGGVLGWDALGADLSLVLALDGVVTAGEGRTGGEAAGWAGLFEGLNHSRAKDPRTPGDFRLVLSHQQIVFTTWVNTGRG